MRYGIGVDTGGTFTDSVLLDLDGRTILSTAKALTTRRDLRMGIAASLAGLDHAFFGEVSLVSLSTTLATNSVVEGKGGRVGLLMLVPDPDTFTLPARVPAEEVAVIRGAHGKDGAEIASLDRAAVEAAVDRMIGRVEAFAVSGYFGVYNNAHEETVKEMIVRRTGRPVICGHELSGEIGLVERGVTAALNGALLPVIAELLDAVKETLVSYGIHAPLMVVKGDGSLILEAVARIRPVETALSGPAASAVGACWLSGERDAMVLDMGGTTTDIGMVNDGVPAITGDGAKVGGWRTCVRAVDMWTIGLGGDSKIAISGGGGITIGPRRAIPLCCAATSHPELLAAVRATLAPAVPTRGSGSLDFFTLVRRPAEKLSHAESRLLDFLDGRAVHRSRIEEEIGPFTHIEPLVSRGLIAEISFTPTDLLHATGDLSLWDSEVSTVGIGFLAHSVASTPNQLADRLFGEIVHRLTLNVAGKGLESDGATDHSPELLSHLFRSNGDRCLKAMFALSRPLIAVGAPVKSFMPSVGETLGGRIVIPEHAQVANAVGAITGHVIARATVHVRPCRPSGFLVVTSDEQTRVDTLDQGMTLARKTAREIALARMEECGGALLDIHVVEDEKNAPLAAGWGRIVFLEAELTAISIGTPKFVTPTGESCAPTA